MRATRGNVTRRTEKNGQRFYGMEGVEDPSVTTVLDQISDYEWARSDGVAKHAAELAECLGGRYRRIVRTWDGTQIVEAWEELDPLTLLKDVKYLKGKGESFAQRDRGTLVDTFMEEPTIHIRDWLDQKLQEGKPPDNDLVDPWPWACDYEEVMPHLVSASKFHLEVDYEPQFQKVWVHSDKLRTGGEIDAGGRMFGNNAIWDYKTSKAPSRRDAMQISVYYACLGLRGYKTYLVYLCKGFYKVVEVTPKQRQVCIAAFRRLRKQWDFDHGPVPWESATRSNVDEFDV